MSSTHIYSFTFEIEKLEAILFMLSYLAGYNLDEVEADAIKLLIPETNDDEEKFLEWHSTGKKYNILLEFTYYTEASWY